MKFSDPYLGTVIFLTLFVAFYLFLNWSSYVFWYFTVWIRFPDRRPLLRKADSTEPWFACRRIEVGSGSIGSNFPTVYFQFNGQTVNIVQRDWLFPLVPRLLGMAVVSAPHFKIASSHELIIFSEAPNPIRVFLEEPLWEPVSKPKVLVYPDGTVVAG